MENKNEAKEACCGPDCCTSKAAEADNAADLKEIVKEKYSEIANQSKEQNDASCCGSGCCSTVDYAIFSESYAKQEGYNPDADLGLGCGIPTEFAQIKEGDTILDLGSGAGNDVFIARTLTGESGKVIGLDMTEAMIEKAEANKAKLGFNNIEFVLGDIESLPLEKDTIDVVLSNCVLNLVPNKEKAFSGIYRVLKPGGHFSVSDIVLEGGLPEGIKKAGEMYAGCVSGAIQKEKYMQIIKDTGFTDVEIKKEKLINLPDDILLDHLSKEEIVNFRNSGNGIYSITVFAKK